MSKPEQQRLEALEALHVLDTPPEARFDRIVRLAQRVFDVPIVAVNLIDSDRQWTKAAEGMEVGGSIPRDIAFCATAIQQPETYVIPDTHADPQWADNPMVVDDPLLRFYAGAPVAAPTGELVGTLCLAGGEPRDLSEQESRLLRDLADWVERELAADVESDQALEVQRRLAPRPLELPTYDIAGACQPTQKVGGDYYDWLHVGDQVQLVLADVMGKGLTASVMAAGLRTALRVTSRFNPLEEAVRRVSATMEEDFSDAGTFTTLFVGQLDPATGAIRYIDAGHGLALVVPASGKIRHLLSHDPPLGAVPGQEFTVQQARLDEGDTLLIFSDGILDAFSDIPSAIAAAEALTVDASASADEMVRQIMALGEREHLEDDLTAVVVRRKAVA